MPFETVGFPLLWTGFNIVFVLGMLALDLGVFHKRAHEVGIREAEVTDVMLGREAPQE